MWIHKCDEELLEPGAIRTEALGMIETFGIVFCIEAADAMCKAADVEMIGFENTASGYISVLVEGDVGACKTAVEAGIKAVEAIGHEVYSSVVIARPHEGLEKNHVSVFIRQAASLSYRLKVMVTEIKTVKERDR